MNHAKTTSQHFSLELPVYQANLGCAILDGSGFPDNYYFQDLGLKHTSFCQSAICYIDGAQGTLLYRGYPVESLCRQYTYESIIYLLLFGELPSKRVLTTFTRKLHADMSVPDYCYQLLEYHLHTVSY